MIDMPVRVRMRSALPWWLADPSEICLSCNHGYAYQTEFYCVECDAAVCPITLFDWHGLSLAAPVATAAYRYGSSATQNGLIRATASVGQRAETPSSA